MMFKRVLGVALAISLIATQAISAPYAWVVYQYNLAATSYTYCNSPEPQSSTDTPTPTCGTTASVGWVQYSKNMWSVAAVVEWTTKNATSLDYSIECRHSAYGIPVIIEQASLGAIGGKSVQLLGLPYDACRIGLKLTTDTGDQVVNAYFAGK